MPLDRPALQYPVDAMRKVEKKAVRVMSAVGHSSGISGDSVFARVKAAIRIEEYIEQHLAVNTPFHSIPDGYKILCQNPGHQEKTPSMNVSATRQRFHCFGCGWSGDVYDYVRVTQNVTMADALRTLASYAGVDISADDDSEEGRILALMRRAAWYYTNLFNKLDADHPAKRQVVDRGLPLPDADANTGKADDADGSVIRYGYAPKGGGLYRFLSKPDKNGRTASTEDMIKAGLVKDPGDGRQPYDMFRHRLMFIITDQAGAPIAFSGRKLDESDTRSGKYVNSPETPVFKKNRSLFNAQGGLRAAHREKAVFVSEGQFDVAAAVASGAVNTVAALGTAFTDQHAALLLRSVGGEGTVYFVFDGDEAGLAAAEKVWEHALSIRERSRVVVCPDGADPCDLLASGGAGAVRALYSTAPSGSEPLPLFVIRRRVSGLDVSDPDQAMRGVRIAGEVLAGVSLAMRDVLAGAAASMVGVSRGAVVEAADRAQGGREQRAAHRGPARSAGVPRPEVDTVSHLAASVDADERVAWLKRVLGGGSLAAVLLLRALSALFYAPLGVRLSEAAEGRPDLVERLESEEARRNELLGRLFHDEATPEVFREWLGEYRRMHWRREYMIEDFENAPVVEWALDNSGVMFESLSAVDASHLVVMVLTAYFERLEEARRTAGTAGGPAPVPRGVGASPAPSAGCPDGGHVAGDSGHVDPVVDGAPSGAVPERGAGIGVGGAEPVEADVPPFPSGGEGDSESDPQYDAAPVPGDPDWGDDAEDWDYQGF